MIDSPKQPDPLGGPRFVVAGGAAGPDEAGPSLQADLRDVPAGVSADEFRQQAELDALLRLQSGELAVRPGLAGRVRRSAVRRRLRIGLESAAAGLAAAVILIGLGVWYVGLLRGPAKPASQAAPGQQVEPTPGQPRTDPLTNPRPIDQPPADREKNSVNPKPALPGGSPWQERQPGREGARPGESNPIRIPPPPVPPGGPGGGNPAATPGSTR